MANIPQYTASNNQQLYNDDLSQALQAAIGTNGFEISLLSSEEIDKIFSGSQNGTVWYDTTRNKFLAKENGTLVSFNTTAI